MTMRWCKYASAASHHGSARCELLFSQGRNLPPSSSSNQCYWSNKTTCVQGAMSRKATWSTRTRTEEEDADEREADSAKDKADKVRPTKTTPNFGRKTEANEEPSQEGGVSTPARVVKTQPNVDIAENSATTKKSAERRYGNRLPQADNSRITRTILTTKSIPECTGTTPTTKIVVECTHATPTVVECS